MAVEMTKGYSMFLDDAVGFFASNPEAKTYTNAHEYYIAIRHFGRVDSVVVYEFFDVISNYSAHVDLQIKDRNNKKGFIK